MYSRTKVSIDTEGVMGTLLQQLKEYSKSDYYPMHMPGHKRNLELLEGFHPYAIDITEIDGFDNLHHAEGVLRDLVERIEKLYHAEKSFLLVNGSTVGILAGISACVNKGDKVIIARNCHKSVYNAVILNELDPIYLYPQYNKEYGIAGGILPNDLEKLLIENPETKLVVITSPTYEGIASDVRKLSDICHKKGVKLLVDEAHGAHLIFHDAFPETSVTAGADIVIHSIHKTLPAFTQSAIMHVSGDETLKNGVAMYLGIYETSSPSYLLMAGVDQCMCLLEEKAKDLFSAYYDQLVLFFSEVQGLKHLRVMAAERFGSPHSSEEAKKDMDMSKILISVKNTNITGYELLHLLLSKYHIQLEMSSFEYGLAMTSIADTEQGFIRLRDALYEIDETLEFTTNSEYDGFAWECLNCKNGKGLVPSDAAQAETVPVLLEKSKEQIATEHIIIYPPGVPLVAAGERISESAVHLVETALQTGYEVLGVSKLKDHRFYVNIVKETKEMVLG